MILLAINTGVNNADLGNLKELHLDLDKAWLDYPRHKTGVERRAKLWPETALAIREYLDVRQTPLDAFAACLFITKARRKWAHSSLPSEFRKLIGLVNAKLDDQGTPIRRPKLNREGLIIKGKHSYELVDDPPIPHGTFSYFRHTFETIGGGSRDQVAVDSIMGHAPGGMAAEYREEIDDERLEAVSNHVHKWLFKCNCDLE